MLIRRKTTILVRIAVVRYRWCWLLGGRGVVYIVFSRLKGGEGQEVVRKRRGCSGSCDKERHAVGGASNYSATLEAFQKPKWICAQPGSMSEGSRRDECIEVSIIIPLSTFLYVVTYGAASEECPLTRPPQTSSRCGAPQARIAALRFRNLRFVKVDTKILHPIANAASVVANPKSRLAINNCIV